MTRGSVFDPTGIVELSFLSLSLKETFSEGEAHFPRYNIQYKKKGKCRYLLIQVRGRVELRFSRKKN